MSTEALELICTMDRSRLEAQIGLQCAPLLAGLKISNLLTVRSELEQQVSRVFCNTGISVFLLYQSGRKAAFFLYRREDPGAEECTPVDEAAGIWERNASGYSAAHFRPL